MTSRPVPLDRPASPIQSPASSPSICPSTTRSPRTTGGGAQASPIGRTCGVRVHGSMGMTSLECRRHLATMTSETARSTTRRPSSPGQMGCTPSATTRTGSVGAACSSNRWTSSQRTRTLRCRTSSAGPTSHGAGAGTGARTRSWCPSITRRRGTQPSSTIPPSICRPKVPADRRQAAPSSTGQGFSTIPCAPPTC